MATTTATTTTLRNRRLDADWDMTFGNGLNCYLSGLEASAQAVKSHLLLFLQEWWMDQDDGLPMWQFILGAGAGSDLIKEAVDRLIVERILSTQLDGVMLVTDVKDISSSFNADTRDYSFTATIDTIFGTITVSTVPFDTGVGL